jgi:hypothetical protein
MNLMTAYAVGTFLERRGQDLPVGERYFDRRTLLQYLKRYDNLSETIDTMASQGLLDQRGIGQKGGGVRTYALTTTGKWFLTNFEKAHPFVMMLEPDLWDEFEMRANSKPGGAELELRKLIAAYNKDATTEATQVGKF